MPDSPAIAVVLETPALAGFLWRVAYAQAMNVKTDLVMTDTETAVMKMIRWGFNASIPGGIYRLVKGHWKEASFAMEARSPAEREVEEFAGMAFRIGCDYFVRCAAQGGTSALQCLEEKSRQSNYALEAVMYKARAAGKVNEEVLGELNRCIDNAQRVKVLAEVSMVVLGAFVPLSWVAQTAIGAAYTLSCEVAKEVSQVPGADLIAFATGAIEGGEHSVSVDNLTGNAAGAAGNIAQDVSGAVASRTAYLAAKSQAENIRLREMMMTRVRGYAAQAGHSAHTGGGNLSGPQVKAVERGFQAIENNNAVVQQAARSNTLGQAAKWGARGASIAVGLYFMKDEIVKAWYGQTEWEEMQRRK